MYKLKFTVLQQEIFRYLVIKAGLSFNLRSLARALEVSSTAIAKALPGLEKNQIVKVKKDKESKRLSIELNRDSFTIIQLKRVENLRMIYESGLVNFLSDSFPGKTIVLFGSYSLGEDTIKSDIDIVIIDAKEKNIELSEYNKKLDRLIFLHFYPDFKKIGIPLKENILNGIVLKGGFTL